MTQPVQEIRWVAANWIAPRGAQLFRRESPARQTDGWDARCARGECIIGRITHHDGRQRRVGPRTRQQDQVRVGLFPLHVLAARKRVNKLPNPKNFEVVRQLVTGTAGGQPNKMIGLSQPLEQRTYLGKSRYEREGVRAITISLLFFERRAQPCGIVGSQQCPDHIVGITARMSVQLGNGEPIAVSLKCRAPARQCLRDAIYQGPFHVEYDEPSFHGLNTAERDPGDEGRAGGPSSGRPAPVARRYCGALEAWPVRPQAAPKAVVVDVPFGTWRQGSTICESRRGRDRCDQDGQ